MKQKILTVLLCLGIVTIFDATTATSTSAPLPPLNYCGVVLAPYAPSGEMVNSTTYQYTGPDSGNILAGNSIDHDWVHLHGTKVVWDMGSALNSVYLIPSIDHTPIPGEARETTLYGSNTATGPWVIGAESTIFDDGPTNWISDDYSALWTFNQ